MAGRPSALLPQAGTPVRLTRQSFVSGESDRCGSWGSRDSTKANFISNYIHIHGCTAWNRSDSRLCWISLCRYTMVGISVIVQNCLWWATVRSLRIVLILVFDTSHIITEYWVLHLRQCWPHWHLVSLAATLLVQLRYQEQYAIDPSSLPNTNATKEQYCNI